MKNALIKYTCAIAIIYYLMDWFSYFQFFATGLDPEIVFWPLFFFAVFTLINEEKTQVSRLKTDK